MHPLPDRSKPPHLPRAVRILPRRSSLRAGLAAAVALTAIFGWFAGQAHGPLPRPLAWIAIGLSALVAIGSAVRLVVQLPIIEASELGIAIWFHGPYRRPFFAPWSRVRAIVLTRARAADDAPGSVMRDALGIELTQDDRFQLPQHCPNDEVPVEGALRADLVWSSRSVSGSPRRWVELLQQMKSAYAEPAE
jgi:hypothetical protein